LYSWLPRLLAMSECSPTATELVNSIRQSIVSLRTGGTSWRQVELHQKKKHTICHMIMVLCVEFFEPSQFFEPSHVDSSHI
jgi:hypothetical protein